MKEGAIGFFMEKLKPKFFTTIRDYSKEQFIKDVISGIIVAIIALPLSIALALASGVTPEKGIYTAIIAGFLVSFLGGSKVQIAGPTAAFATIVAGIVAKSGMDGLIVATIMAGISCGNDLHCHINHLAQTGKNQCDTGITYCSDCIDCAGQGIIYAGQYHWRSV